MLRAHCLTGNYHTLFQVCGEATYVDDMKIHGMLHAALVVSSRPHAKILSVDATAAANVTLSLALSSAMGSNTAWLSCL